MRDLLYSWVDSIFGSGMFSSVETILKINPSKGNYATVWNTITTIYDSVCVPIGMGLVLIYFMINLIEKSLQQNAFDLEQFFKLLLKLFVGLYLIEHGLEIMASIYSLSFAFVNSILNQAGDAWGSDLTNKVWKELTGENKNGEWGVIDTIIKGIPLLLELLIPWICSFIMKIVINFVCYTRLIEFYIKTCAAPIALSDFFTEGVHGNGWKFLKGYIAIALQSGVIMLSVVIFNSIAGGIIGGFGAGYGVFLLKYLALGFATVGVMLKSLSLTKEIVGAS